MPDCLHRSCFVRNRGDLPQDPPQFLPYDPQLTTFRHSWGYHSVFFVILQDRTSVLSILFCAHFRALLFAYVAPCHFRQRKILCLSHKKERPDCIRTIRTFQNFIQFFPGSRFLLHGGGVTNSDGYKSQSGISVMISSWNPFHMFALTFQSRRSVTMRW